MSDQLRILVVDDDHSMARTLTDILRVKGHQVEAVYSGAEALEKLSGIPFDCVLSDIKMAGINGVELYRAIKAKTPDLPVVLMTAYSSDGLVQEGLEEGVVAVLTKPLDIGLLLTFFSYMQRERLVVIVDDDPRFCKTLGDILRTRGFNVAPITSPHVVIKALDPQAEVVLLDMKLNSVGGLEVLRQIRQRYPHLPVILVTGHFKEMALAIETALEINAYTCLYKPLEMEKLFEVLAQVRLQYLGRVLGRPVEKEKGGGGQ
jgi:CheY-like chemotaxis protein